MSDKKEFGDYQTPLDFAEKICNFLKEQKNLNPETIFEPTCGIGNFLKASMIFDAEKYFAVDINENYCKICAENFSDKKIIIWNENFFNFDSSIIPKENLLIIGNPPWALNSNIEKNLPTKNNYKNLKGIDALTGSSNFDICEYIIKKIIDDFRNTNTAIAMLCKISVAKNIFEYLFNNKIFFSCCEIFEFDAKKIFEISANAGLLFINLTSQEIFSSICNIYKFDNPSVIKKSFGYKNEKFFGNLLLKTCDFDGKCCFEWRQGIKHDCAKIMELTFDDGIFKNGNDEIIDVDEETIYPLIKGSMIKSPIINSFSKYVIVTQKFLGEDTSHLEFDAPKTWKYLKKNLIFFEKRESKIYKNSAEFSMFGIGDYSFLPYKVCIGGFNKKSFFSLVYSPNKKIIMPDDTTYFIGFEDYELAYTAMIYLNTEKVQDFLKRLSFSDTKRPFTKKILSRIDFSKICDEISFEEFVLTEKKLNLENNFRKSFLEKFFNLVKPSEQKLF